jgi:hypothetical protein
MRNQTLRQPGRKLVDIPAERKVTVNEDVEQVGVVAGFWHITWTAGVAMLAAGLAAVAVHSAGYARLEGYRWPRAGDGGGSGDAGS